MPSLALSVIPSDMMKHMFKLQETPNISNLYVYNDHHHNKIKPHSKQQMSHVISYKRTQHYRLPAMNEQQQ